MVGFTFLLLLFIPFVVLADRQKKFEALEKGGSWPHVCEQHPYAISASASAFDEDNGATCTLKFPYFTTDAERLELCRDMFSDNVRSHSGDHESTTCVYERIYRCEPGFTLVRSACVKLHGDVDTYNNAVSKCKAMGGSLVGEYEKEDLRYIFYLLNPLKFNLDVRVAWTGPQKQIIMRRGVDLPGQPGQIVPSFHEKAHFYCWKNVFRARIAYKRYCEVLKNSFKLTAHFEMGNCFMLSPSMSTDHSINGADSVSQKEKDFQHFHDRCQWISSEGYAASPITHTRKTGIMKLLESSKRVLPVILPGFRVEKESFYLMNKNIKKGKIESEEIDHGRHMFAMKEPKTKGGVKNKHLLASAEDFDSSATSLAMGSSAENYRVHSMPEFFRGHRICMSGVSQQEMPLKQCNDPSSAKKELHSGWKGILRDNGHVMCIKAFIKELNTNDPKKSIDYQCRKYSDAKKICDDLGGFVTPIQSKEEQSLVQDAIQEKIKEIEAFESKYGGVPAGRKVENSGSIWLGATKKDKTKITMENFLWDYDQAPIGYANFKKDEPNNYDKNEQCLQMMLQEKTKFQWNDIGCQKDCSAAGPYRNHGTVCARFIQD